jgi:hypothetical protein
VSCPSDQAERQAEQITGSIMRAPKQARPSLPVQGRRFDQVRIHSDHQAQTSAEMLSARAFALGNHIVLGAHASRVGSEGRERLIAHELVHTLQPASERVIHRVPQEPTLDEARKSGKALPTQSLATMDVQTLSTMSSSDRRTWHESKLGAFENQLKASAAKHVVPVQLLATVILNELADIDWRDVLQSGLFVSKGSLGIAQIQIDTAMNDNLFPDLTAAEGTKAYDEMVSSLRPGLSRTAARIMQTKDKETRLAVNKRLQIPQHAIDAAAREIRILLDRMIANRGASWQTKLGFTHGGLGSGGSAQLIYADVAGSDQREKELKLSNLITGAYNSPNVIAAADSSMSKFPNANIHGQNSRMIAGDLFDFGLFRP